MHYLTDILIVVFDIIFLLCHLYYSAYNEGSPDTPHSNKTIGFARLPLHGDLAANGEIKLALLQTDSVHTSEAAATRRRPVQRTRSRDRLLRAREPERYLKIDVYIGSHYLINEGWWLFLYNNKLLETIYL